MFQLNVRFQLNVTFQLNTGLRISNRLTVNSKPSAMNTMKTTTLQPCQPCPSPLESSQENGSSEGSPHSYACSAAEEAYADRMNAEESHGRRCALPDGNSFYSEPYFARTMSKSSLKKQKSRKTKNGTKTSSNEVRHRIHFSFDIPNTSEAERKQRRQLEPNARTSVISKRTKCLLRASSSIEDIPRTYQQQTTRINQEAKMSIPSLSRSIQDLVMANKIADNVSIAVDKIADKKFLTEKKSSDEDINAGSCVSTGRSAEDNLYSPLFVKQDSETPPGKPPHSLPMGISEIGNCLVSKNDRPSQNSPHHTGHKNAVVNIIGHHSEAEIN